MAGKQQQVEGKPSALTEELRAAGHKRIADKLEVHNALWRPAEPGVHQELAPHEVAAQREHALTAAEMATAQRVEYSTWRAAEEIFHEGALAYAAGHPVPISNVERWGYDELGLVERVAPPADRHAEDPAGDDAAPAEPAARTTKKAGA